MNTKACLLALLLASVVSTNAGCSADMDPEEEASQTDDALRGRSSSKPTVSLSSKGLMVDGKGMTLYYVLNDALR